MIIILFVDFFLVPITKIDVPRTVFLRSFECWVVRLFSDSFFFFFFQKQFVDTTNDIRH